MSETNERYEQMMQDCRDGDNKDFTALVKMMQNMKYGYHQNKEQAADAARKEGNWSERDVNQAIHLVYDYGM